MDLTLCLTHDCNLRCGYCYAGRKHKKTMPWAIAKEGIDFGIRQALAESVQTGKQPRMTLGFFGGEPLIEWDLLQTAHDYFMERAKALDIRPLLTLTTNMSLLDEEKATWLKDSGYFIGLSLDGNEAMHNTWRKYADGRGSHEDCIKALRFFNKPDSRAEVIVVVDPRNLAHLADSVRWLADQSPLRIALNPNFSAEWDDDSLALLTAQYEAVADFYVERYKEGNPVRINILDGKIKTHLQGGYQACDRCGFGEREVAISVSGHFYPCARLVGNDDDLALRFGDVEKGYDEAKRIRFILGRGNRNPSCAECSLNSRCMNWCGCVNYVTSNGAIDQVGGFTCFHEKLSINVSDRAAEELWKLQNPAFIQRFYAAQIKASAKS